MKAVAQLKIMEEMELVSLPLSAVIKVVLLMETVLLGKSFQKYRYKIPILYSFRFGVCCVFIISTTSSKTANNCSYIQNPDFPSVYSETSSLTYTIEKCSPDVCAVRLDFETFTTAGPSATDETNGGACTDSFVVTGTSGLTTPTICGKNSGQHSKTFFFPYQSRFF